MGVEPLTCGLSGFCTLSPQEKEIVTGLAVVYFVISTTPTLHHSPLFLSRSISFSLPSHYTLSLSLYEQCLSDEDPAELMMSLGSYVAALTVAAPRKACWDKQS